MNGKLKYYQVFTETLGVDSSKFENLKYNSIPAWDSVGHMGLIAALEEKFDIMMDMDDIIDFNSFEKGIIILKKYGIEING
jgi:acyl carrier protein